MSQLEDMSRPQAGKHTATFTGPIEGGQHGWAFGAYSGDLSEWGYVEEEYFLSGSATAYRPSGAFGLDGLWAAEPADSAPYTTRVVVRRPTDPARFNGIVVVEWTNVTSGFDLFATDTPSLYDGFAYVAVSAQKVGVTGFATNPAGLVAWDGQRYGALTHPGDAYSYDIYTQTARAVGPNRPRGGVDPLVDLDVTKVISSGASQSAQRLLTYVNVRQPVDRAFDAFLVAELIGSGSSLDNVSVDPTELATMSPDELQAVFGTPGRFRDDLDVPVMVVNTECEAVLYATSRQPDTERFRFWEVAGASHAPAPMMAAIGAKVVRDFATPFEVSGGLADATIPPSTVEWLPVYDAALVHLSRWLGGGAPPPSQPRIDLSDDGSVARDRHGNAKGGIRLPDVEVPVAGYDGGGIGPGTIGLGGRTEPFGPEQLRTLYPSHDVYVDQVSAAARAAEGAGVIRPRRSAWYMETARAAAIPA
jgi:hypothetical protein